MIGTPFEIKNNEVHNWRVQKWDKHDYALDEKGKWMFHGAFTGGNTKEANDYREENGF